MDGGYEWYATEGRGTWVRFVGGGAIRRFPGGRFKSTHSHHIPRVLTPALAMLSTVSAGVLRDNSTLLAAFIRLPISAAL